MFLLAEQSPFWHLAEMFIGSSGLIVIAWLQTRAAKRVEEVKTTLATNTKAQAESAQQQAGKIAEVHGLVNGQNSALIQKNENLEIAIARLEKIIVNLTKKQSRRGRK